QVQSFAQQLVNTVAFLHDNRLIHTDLKPENLMLVDNETILVPTSNPKKMRRILKDTRIILIDFGSTILQDDYHSAVVSTRHYRAPEILLSLGWSYPCDIVSVVRLIAQWSIGCILAELYTGMALFQTHDNLEHLRMMEIVLGPFPHSLTHQLRCVAQV
ncbi:dual specificity protein kinase kns1, partial [Kappamyces sp. JEL0680]